MTELSYLPEAARDIQIIFDWYEQQRAGLGEEFLVELGEAERAVVRSPTAFRTIRGRTRRYLLRRFPLKILYRATEEQVVVVDMYPHASVATIPS